MIPGPRFSHSGGYDLRLDATEAIQVGLEGPGGVTWAGRILLG